MHVCVCMVAAAFALALATPEPRPEVSQQITWFYATSLTSGAHFLTSLGFSEVNGTKQASLCRIFHAAPSHYLGVCDSRPAPTCPKGPEGSKDAPPVTYTLVVPGTREVDAWHSHLTALGPRVVRVTAPGHSIRFAVYAFNFYDVLADGLGCYRFEVQAFQDPAWPKPEPIAVPIPVAVAPPTRPMAVMAAPPTPLLPPPPPPPRRVTLDLFVASKCPDASRCERMLEPVLQAVGELVEVRLSFLGERTAGGGVACLHGESECVGNKAQLCTHKHWPSHVDVDTRGLPAHLNWLLFLRCAAEAEGGRPFNTTAASRIPGNTHACLQRYSVPSATADAIDACVRGAEGATLLAEAIARTHTLCGHHSSRPKTACKSCTMSIDGKPACVLDEGVYNCTGLASSQAWVARLCDAAARAGWAPSALPLACRAPSMAAGGPSWPGPSWPTVQGHSYASIDPRSSADFAIRYFGATLLSDSRPRCLGKADERPPREVSVRLPRHADFRGGGLELRFVSNPRKPGGAYDTAAHTAAMTLLFGNLSVNTGHHWNQFFDFHLGFYARPSDLIAADLLRDGVPFFTGQSAGVYQSIYVAIPGTGHIVEVLGDWYLPALPPCHVRFSSTDQFCSPKRRRRLRVSAPPLPGLDLGVAYSPGDADTNKTTMAGADPRAAIEFAVRYLGGSPVQQHRGPMADGPCTTLAWAEWPDSHEWHVVRYDTADWVSSDGLRPAVPFNVSQLAEYVEALRDLTHGTYDQWLDHREVLSVGNLTELARVLRGDGVPFAVRSRPDEGTCSLLVDLPRNGLAVEVVSRVFDGAWLARRCAANEFDLCAPD